MEKIIAIVFNVVFPMLKEAAELLQNLKDGKINPDEVDVDGWIKKIESLTDLPTVNETKNTTVEQEQ